MQFFGSLLKESFVMIGKAEDLKDKKIQNLPRASYDVLSYRWYIANFTNTLLQLSYLDQYFLCSFWRMLVSKNFSFTLFGRYLLALLILWNNLENLHKVQCAQTISLRNVHSWCLQNIWLERSKYKKFWEQHNSFIFQKLVQKRLCLKSYIITEVLRVHI